MRQKVFILGATGNVGNKLIEQITELDGIDKNANPTDIIGIANSRRMLVSENSLNTQIVSEVSSVQTKILELLETRGKDSTDMIEILQELKKNGHGGEVIIVDVTAAKGEAITKFHLDAVSPEYGFSISTANKNVVSLGNQATFDTVTGAHGLYDYNTAVMAGAGAVDFLKGAKDTHDRVLSIEGCFSGTLGYIASELEKGEKTFSEIVTQAKELGYTEPNPWDDLNGLDVARKLLILARTAGYEAEMHDVEIQGFIDSRYADVAEEDFLEAIKEEDILMAEKFATALTEGKTLRYVGSMKLDNDKLVLKVGLQEVEITSPIGSLQGTNNIARIETQVYHGDQAWTNIAPGAGLDTTALSIRKGIAKMLPHGLPRNNGN